jgi:hypothetical protein
LTKKTTPQLTKSQQMMVDDGCPIDLVTITREERNAWWEKNPPRTFRIDPPQDDPRIQKEREIVEAIRKEQTDARINRMKNSLARKALKQVDHSRDYWDSRLARWRPIKIIQGDAMAKRWKVVPYNAAGEIVQRGATSIEEGTEQVQLLAKIAWSYHRCNKTDQESITKIIVEDAAGGYVREWTKATDAPLPKLPPTPHDKPVTDKPDEQPKKSKTKAKGNSKDKPAAPAKGKKPPPKPRGGPGIITTITEMIVRKIGASVDEMLAALSKQFPDKNPKGMRSTIITQMGRQGASKRDDDKRGKVYFK